MAILGEILISLLGVVISAAIGKKQMEDMAARSAHETKVRKAFEAVKNKFGVSIDQLNQLSEKMGINLNRLSDAARGSARLSQASKVYRDYVSKYPNKIESINKLKNSIQSEINHLSEAEENAASRIQTGGTVSNQDIGKLTQGSIIKVNQGINEINTTLSEKEQFKPTDNQNLNEISTELTTKEG